MAERGMRRKANVEKSIHAPLKVLRPAFSSKLPHKDDDTLTKRDISPAVREKKTLFENAVKA
jgi:hypothetical protein